MLLGFGGIGLAIRRTDRPSRYAGRKRRNSTLPARYRALLPVGLRSGFTCASNVALSLILDWLRILTSNVFGDSDPPPIDSSFRFNPIP